MIKYTWTGIELDTISHYADLGLIAGQAIWEFSTIRGT